MSLQKNLILIVSVAATILIWFFFQPKTTPKPLLITQEKPTETYPDIIKYPPRNDHIIQSNHQEIQAPIDMSLPENILDMGMMQVKRKLPNLEGWQSNINGVLGGNVKHISEKMMPESWQAEPTNPLKYQRYNNAYSIEWKTEEDRVVGMVAYFKSTSVSAEMMSLQSLLAGRSEGWQIDWYRKENQKQKEGVLSLSDGREIYYLMDFDTQASVLTPITVYFELNQRVHRSTSYQ
jgi:hypothetical protein